MTHLHAARDGLSGPTASSHARLTDDRLRLDSEQITAPPAGSAPIPPLPPGAVAAAMPHLRSTLAGLPEILDGARTAALRHGTVVAFARTAHALRHCDPAVVCWLAAATIVELAEADR